VDVDALRASWAKVAQLGDHAAEIFYAILFTTAPQTQAMFPPSMAIQREKLLQALGDIVTRVDDPAALAEFSAQLGRDHRRFGVLAQHYPVVGQAFLETLRRGLGPSWTPALAADWAAAYNTAAQLMAVAAEQAARSSPPWWNGEVIDVQRRAPEITVTTVRVDQPYPFVAGQSAAVEYEQRPRIWRYLSPANAIRPDNTLEFHIRAIAGGLLSPTLVYRLSKGDRLRVGPPVGTALTRHRDTSRDLLLVAGGTGLAPLRAIVEDLATRPSPPEVTLIVGASTARDLYDVEYLRRRDDALAWLTVIPAVADDPGWRGPHGSAVDLALRHGAGLSRDVYVCGSPPMVAGTRQRLLAAGLRPDQIYSEDFSNSAYRGMTREVAPEVRA
jgi:NAD(P)H-flavin reductase/hemoglobin-like flavoprotein